MQIQSKIPAFADFSARLMEADAMTNPAEIHGVLVGLVCSGERLDGKLWLNAVLRLLETRASLSPANQQMVIELYNSICQQLNGDGEDFYPLLPGDDQALTSRAQALSRWCEGFLYGLGLGSNGQVTVDYFSEDIHDVLHCITEVASLDFEKIEVTEQSIDIDAVTYKNMLSYIRKGVWRIYHAFAEKPKHLH